MEITKKINKSKINDFLAILNNNHFDYDFQKVNKIDLIENEYYLVNMNLSEKELDILENDEDYIYCVIDYQNI